MSDLAERVLEDLRAFAEELLECGLATQGAAVGAEGGSRTLSAVLRTAETFERLVPDLLAELDFREDPSRTLVHAVRSPVRAKLSARPGDYERHEGRLLPRVWVREVPVLLPDTEPLRWALYLRDRIAADLTAVEARYTKWIDEAALARLGDSEYARRDADELAAIANRIAERREQLDRSRERLRRAAGGAITPRATVPRPLPPSPAWNALRRLARGVVQPLHMIGPHVAELLRAPVQVADLPYLYQRWCGMKVVQTLELLGWSRETDVVGPLFLGGRIHFLLDGVALDLWVEPRLTSSSDHPCGLRAVRGESTPDFVFCTPGRNPLGGRAQRESPIRAQDHFVLDPTLSIDPAVLSGKGKYLSALASSDVSLIAGSPAYATPLRSWAAAPLETASAQVFPVREPGSCGALPMNPVRWNPKPLTAWLGDLTAHAMAWGNPKPS